MPNAVREVAESMGAHVECLEQEHLACSACQEAIETSFFLVFAQARTPEELVELVKEELRKDRESDPGD